MIHLDCEFENINEWHIYIINRYTPKPYGHINLELPYTVCSMVLVFDLTRVLFISGINAGQCL